MINTQLTTRQLAEILIGIARAQQTVILALESSRAGFKGKYLVPVLDTAAKVRAGARSASLMDYPSRVLLQCQGRSGPTLDQVIKDLEELLSPEAAALSADAAAAAHATVGAGAPAASADKAPAAGGARGLELT